MPDSYGGTESESESVSQFLLNNRDRIVSLWMDRMVTKRAGPPVPRSVLEDHVPEILLLLGKALRNGDHPRVVEASAKHALERLTHGFAIDDLFLEYVLLRRCIFDVWQHERGDVIDLASLLSIDGVLDVFVGAAISRFFSARMRALQAIDDLAQTAFDALDLPGFLDRVMRTSLSKIGPADIALAFLRQDDLLHLKTAIGIEVPSGDGPVTVEWGDGFVGSIASERKARVLRQMESDSVLQGLGFHKHGVRVLYGIPLMREDDLLGVVLLGSTAVSDFSEEDLLLCRLMCARASGAILVGLVLDDERRARAELEAVIESIPQAVYFGNERTLTRANKAGMALLGLKDKRDVLMPPTEVIQHIQYYEPDADVPIPQDEFPFQRALRGETVNAREVLLVNTLSGEKKFASTSAAPVVSGGKIIGAVAVSADVTERKQAEIERERLFIEAREAVRQRDEVLAVVSHDLRNPLGSIMMTASSLLRQATLGEAGRRVTRGAEIIHRAAERMDRLIRDLVDLSALQARALRMERVPLDPRALVSEVVESFLPEARERGVRLRSSVPGDCPPCLGDRDRLVQVFSNIVVNALKVTPAGGEISVGVSAGNNELLFAVRDTGPGIAEENQVHLFERYWRGDRAGYAGMGLGLAIAKGIINIHGGRIWVESQVGKGSAFFFTVPSVSSDPTRANPQGQQAQHASDQSANGGGGGFA